ncbi:hypothetical protein BDZ85DRAFT_132247 [Elsinoe ampelina]|uniref:Uncharacterized protein n=1 Tax=Elsinoe ampelina TaxID=302913 RepID=A0A6A6G7L5_9PEZI|nr:hypothetical protein BDZ85DRAFT_132247 [Elsinoe ampelina]
MCRYQYHYYSQCHHSELLLFQLCDKQGTLPKGQAHDPQPASERHHRTDSTSSGKRYQPLRGATLNPPRATDRSTSHRTNQQTHQYTASIDNVSLPQGQSVGIAPFSTNDHFAAQIRSALSDLDPSAGSTPQQPHLPGSQPERNRTQLGDYDSDYTMAPIPMWNASSTTRWSASRPKLPRYTPRSPVIPANMTAPSTSSIDGDDDDANSARDSFDLIKADIESLRQEVCLLKQRKQAMGISEPSSAADLQRLHELNDRIAFMQGKSDGQRSPNKLDKSNFPGLQDDQVHAVGSKVQEQCNARRPSYAKVVASTSSTANLKHDGMSTRKEVSAAPGKAAYSKQGKRPDAPVMAKTGSPKQQSKAHPPQYFTATRPGDRQRRASLPESWMLASSPSATLRKSTSKAPFLVDSKREQVAFSPPVLPPTRTTKHAVVKSSPPKAEGYAGATLSSKKRATLADNQTRNRIAPPSVSQRSTKKPSPSPKHAMTKPTRPPTQQKTGTAAPPESKKSAPEPATGEDTTLKPSTEDYSASYSQISQKMEGQDDRQHDQRWQVGNQAIVKSGQHGNTPIDAIRTQHGNTPVDVTRTPSPSRLPRPTASKKRPGLLHLDTSSITGRAKPASLLDLADQHQPTQSRHYLQSSRLEPIPRAGTSTELTHQHVPPTGQPRNGAEAHPIHHRLTSQEFQAAISPQGGSHDQPPLVLRDISNSSGHYSMAPAKTTIASQQTWHISPGRTISQATMIRTSLRGDAPTFVPTAAPATQEPAQNENVCTTLSPAPPTYESHGFSAHDITRYWPDLEWIRLTTEEQNLIMNERRLFRERMVAASGQEPDSRTPLTGAWSPVPQPQVKMDPQGNVIYKKSHYGARRAVRQVPRHLGRAPLPTSDGSVPGGWTIGSAQPGWWYGWHGGDGKEIAFTGSRPAAEKDPRSPVNFRNAQGVEQPPAYSSVAGSGFSTTQHNQTGPESSPAHSSNDPHGFGLTSNYSPCGNYDISCAVEHIGVPGSAFGLCHGCYPESHVRQH